MLPFLTWDLLRAPVALASEGQGFQVAQEHQRPRWDQPMPSPPALLLLPRRDRQGLGLLRSS